MPRLVRAILIDPFACTVTEVQHDADDYRNIYALISHETMEVTSFDAAYPDILKGRDAIFVDDEGLMKDAERMFVVHGYPNALAGKGLILGADESGDTQNASTPIEIARHAVAFLTETPAGWTVTTTPWTRKEGAAQ